MVKQADWIIDLGPEGGEAGGRIVAHGTPEQVARVKKSYTGQALARALRSHEGDGTNGASATSDAAASHSNASSDRQKSAAPTIAV